MHTIKKWILLFLIWVAEIINYYITEPLCDYHKRRMRWILPIIALCALTYLLSFVFMRQWWFNRIVVSVAPWTYIRTAKAAEMTDEQYTRFLFGKQADTFLQIIKVESGHNPYAINKNSDGSYDLGCAQLNEKYQLKPRKLTRADAFDCKRAIGIGHQIYQEQGNFCAWYGFRKLYPKACK